MVVSKVNVVSTISGIQESVRVSHDRVIVTFTVIAIMFTTAIINTATSSHPTRL